MANPRIVYDGTNLDFPNPASPPWEDKRDSDRNLVISHGGVHSVSLRNQFDLGRLVLENFEDEDFERELWAWWSWAVRGEAYSVALDSADVIDTTLDGAAAAGQAVIPLTSTAGIVVGTRYKLREAAGDEEEMIEVLSINAGVDVTATANLKYGYVSGDTFVSRDFLPKVVSFDSVKPWRRNLTTFTFDHRFREVS